MLTKKDLLVLPFMFGQNGWEEFRRFDYYRCPICRGLKRKVKINWEETKYHKKVKNNYAKFKSK